MLVFPVPQELALPSEEELDRRPGVPDTLDWLPDFSVDDETSKLLEHAPLRAGVTVHLGAAALRGTLAAVERNLAGRLPHVWVKDGQLQAHFMVTDESYRAWRKVIEMGWALAHSFGGLEADLLDFHIRELERERQRH